MKLKLTLIAIILTISTPSYALFGLITKDDLQLIKAKVDSVEAEFNEALVKAELKLNADIAAIKLQIDKSQKNSLGDNSKVVNNSTGLMLNVIYAQSGIIALLVILMLWGARRRFDGLLKAIHNSPDLVKEDL